MDQDIELFRSQYDSIAERYAPKKRDMLRDLRTQILDVYQHDDVVFPYINGIYEEAGVSFWKRVEFSDLFSQIFVQFCSRTGKGALLGSVQTLSEYMVSWPGPDLQKKRVARGGSLVCANSGCGQKIETKPRRTDCPQCHGGKAVIRFQTQPLGSTPTRIKPDGLFWGIDIRDDRVIFAHKKLTEGVREIPFSDIAVINVEYWVVPGVFHTGPTSTGKLHISVFDSQTKCIYETYSSEKFMNVDFHCFVDTARARAPGVTVFDTGIWD